ncbi:lytic polysaccharide monooxygenase auxiliary activity family 9 protein [Streptomyces sp. WI04-05B]|uniref:lytic polysaccharide monooxygenase auxiliary activity family 9 protein n=1 Tax=Streptomyces TaxID=1883 RepID=UPI0029B33C37|nr:MULTISPECIES: lytic polysaccharide monooxygenase [unclassified Streptomyces]MDX2546626.1 lytic polysaccharide monooxygenase [Streptomyces sp. WI04-05B]MDX2587743.1 lytic polysaccharide monooxygenase [Streptomyces sp. WI04-05A]MDX3751659.1 lytic polysaccharide monooxygenase [Streptomyces sp. AK08-02]
MTVHRRTLPAAVLAGAAAFAAPLLLTLSAAGPAQAHGAPTKPVSRAFACSPDGGSLATTAACRAAVTANGGAPFTFWDNLRVANVNGRDRAVIPDGRLCSGGLPDYRGLDLARSDWPSTTLTPGARLTMTYRSTIPHTGTFKMFLTKPGYDPSGPLKWSDLPDRPFAEVKDPTLTGDAYRIEMTLPSDRTGRHVLYTIWQNSSTPDTYYSCSDVVFPAAKGNAGSTGGTDDSGASTPTATAPSAARSGSAASATPAEQPARAAETEEAAESADSAAPQAAGTVAGAPVASTTDDAGPRHLIAGAAAAVLLATVAAIVLRLRRR